MTLAFKPEIVFDSVITPGNDVLFAGLFAFAGGLKAIAKVNVFQMILLICVSLTLSIIGL